MSKYFYVIMPLTSDPDSAAKQNILHFEGRNHGVEPYFPFDHMTGTLSAVLSDIKNACFVFADLTCERPSCYYEIGLADALAKPVILVAKKGTRIHQVYGHVRFYESISHYASLVLDAVKHRTL